MFRNVIKTFYSIISFPPWKSHSALFIITKLWLEKQKQFNFTPFLNSLNGFVVREIIFTYYNHWRSIHFPVENNEAKLIYEKFVRSNNSLLYNNDRK